MSRAREGRPAFLVDAMLGDVARWLRILGEDAQWVPPEWRDEELVAAAGRERRVIVTRDHGLVARAEKAGLTAILVPQAEPAEVMYVLYRNLASGPADGGLATRCATCNGPLAEVAPEEAAERAEAAGKQAPTAGVRARHDTFWSCTVCAQAYWRGSHWETIVALRDALVARLGR